MDVGREKEGIKGVFFVYSHHAVTKTMGMEGNIYGEDRGGSYRGSCKGFHTTRRRSRVIRDIRGSPTSV